MPKNDKSGGKKAKMVGVWLSDRLLRAIKRAVDVDSDFTVSEFIRDAIALRLRTEYPSIWQKLHEGEEI